jgi:hypothetical protein
MNAYRKWAANEVKYLPKKEKVAEVKPNPEIADWTEVYNKFLEMEVSPQSIPAEIFDWLFYTGKIKLTSDEKRELLKRAIPVKRQWLFDEITHKSTPERLKYLKEFNRQVQEDDFMQDTIDELKKVGKKIFVHERMQKEKQTA